MLFMFILNLYLCKDTSYHKNDIIYKLYLFNDLIALSIPKQPVSNNNYIVEIRIMIYNNQLIILYI